MQFKEAELGSSLMWMRSLRLGGIVLLGLFALDLAESIVPVRWMDPAWELQVIGAIIERSPVPLLGFILFFYGDALLRSSITRFLAGVLSWLALAFGLALFLVLPLLVADTSRLIDQIQSRITSQIQQQASQSNQLEAELQVASAEDLANVLHRLGRSGEGQTEAEMRSSLAEDLRQMRESTLAQARRVADEQAFGLVKRSWKWGAQALLMGLAMVYIWRQSVWARQPAQSNPAQ